LLAPRRIQGPLLITSPVHSSRLQPKRRPAPAWGGQLVSRFNKRRVQVHATYRRHCTGLLFQELLPFNGELSVLFFCARLSSFNSVMIYCSWVRTYSIAPRRSLFCFSLSLSLSLSFSSCLPLLAASFAVDRIPHTMPWPLFQAPRPPAAHPEKQPQMHPACFAQSG